MSLVGIVLNEFDEAIDMFGTEVVLADQRQNVILDLPDKVFGNWSEMQVVFELIGLALKFSSKTLETHRSNYFIDRLEVEFYE